MIAIHQTCQKAAQGLRVVLRNRKSFQQRSIFGRSAKAPSASKEDRVVTFVDTKTGICTVELNRPEKLNALDMPMFYALRDTAESLKQNQSIRAIVLKGRGRAFCTGLDVPSMVRNGGKAATKELLERKDPSQVANLAQQVAYAWRELPVPVICSLHGMCFGGGLQIALGADLRLATPDCRLSIMETKWGLIPDMSAAVTLRELISIDVAKELTWTGRVVDGTEAAQLGLVTRVVADPHQAALDLAHEIAQRSPDAVGAAKELYQTTWTAVPADYCLRVETALQERLLLSWNQIAASSRAFGWRLPFFQRQKRTLPVPPAPVPSSSSGGPSSPMNMSQQNKK